jgi:hypothetical protein
MKRREFIALMGASVTWPFAAMAQQPGRSYRLGLVSPVQCETALTVAFLEKLQQFGFVEGQNRALTCPRPPAAAWPLASAASMPDRNFSSRFLPAVSRSAAGFPPRSCTSRDVVTLPVGLLFPVVSRLGDFASWSATHH